MDKLDKIFFPASCNDEGKLIAYFYGIPAGESGSADTVRDPRGFAVKFYTEEGNWDLTGNNTPIFFIRDSMLVSGVKRTMNQKAAFTEYLRST